MLRAPVCLLVLLSLPGCSMVSRMKPAPQPDYSATLPPTMESLNGSEGAVYRSGYGLALFEDLKARRVGDIITVLLVERTDASKTASTNTSKSNDVDTGSPVLAGRPVTMGGTPILNNTISAERDFTGEGDSTQSNSLDGSVSVTVAQVLPNGNLYVRGQKRITLNQGEEFIQIAGIVRPIDVSTANTVLSTRMADAQITYSGKGAIASSNKPGWLTRFFSSPWFPY
jgi:flagellar L-ring protein precursor FlgH